MHFDGPADELRVILKLKDDIVHQRAGRNGNPQRRNGRLVKRVVEGLIPEAARGLKSVLRAVEVAHASPQVRFSDSKGDAHGNPTCMTGSWGVLHRFFTPQPSSVSCLRGSTESRYSPF